MQTKTCNKCNKELGINMFSKKSDNKDGRHNTCSPCRIKREREVKLEKANGTFKQHDRSEAAKLGHKNLDREEFRKSLSESKKQSIKAIHTITNEIKYYNSAKEAIKDGFHASNISEAISSGKPYKEYTWYKYDIEPKDTTIYMHTNTENGMVYIGKTTQVPSRRFRKSDNTYHSYKSCIKFYKALCDYGWSSFETHILEIVPKDRFDEVSEIEAKYISKYNSIETGYNTVDFSEGLHVFPQEVKDKLSESMKKRHASGEFESPYNKVHHQFVDGVESKKCTACDIVKPLSKFGVSPKSYDKKQHNCKPCRAASQRMYRELNAKPKKKIDYSLRRDAMSAGAKRAYENNPELRKNISKRQSKPIQGTNIETGEIKTYPSGIAAKADGFDNRQISLAIKSGKPHRGYTWKKI